MHDAKDIFENKLEQQEEIALLTFQSKQDYKLARQAHARVRRAAIYAAAIVFVVMSIFIHSALITGNAGFLSHGLAFVANTVLAIILYKSIHEFHPLKAIADRYDHSCEELRQRIKKLSREMHD